MVTLFDILVAASFWYFEPTALQNSKGNPLRGGLNTRRSGNFANIALYLGNGTRWGYSYYGTLIGSHR